MNKSKKPCHLKILGFSQKNHLKIWNNKANQVGQLEKLWFFVMFFCLSLGIYTPHQTLWVLDGEPKRI